MVDMNILHDYSPVQFMSSIQLFIEQVNKVEFIDEFLSCLRYVRWIITWHWLMASKGKKMFVKPCTKIL
jgi:hypothetical protein